MYSHDGIRDSLTQLAAPTLLYEELRRELARAKRQGQPISMIRFLLVPDALDPHDDESTTYFECEEEVIDFAQTLTDLSRGEDLCARMGELEFVCVLHGLEEASKSFVSRISLRWHEAKVAHTASQVRNDLSLLVASLVSKPNESALEFLSRLDLEPTIAQ